MANGYEDLINALPNDLWCRPSICEHEQCCPKQAVDTLIELT